MSKHLVLTGGAGFIGHHTIEHVLKNTDWTITTIDRLSYAGNLNRLTDLDCWEAEKGRVRFVYHDFRAEIMPNRFRAMKADFFIHMGAESHVDRSITDPLPFAESNVVGTVHMLNLAHALQAERTIYVSTDEVYGATVGGKLHREGEPHRPSNPYSASKSGGEAFAYSFWNTYKDPIMITNTMNNFGERQDTEKFVPGTILKLWNDEPVVLHVKKDADGAVVDISSRCWLHARNHADALLFLLENGIPGERYNIVGVRASVEEVANRIATIMNIPDPDLTYIDFHSFRPGHDMHYGLDGSKLAKLGWKAPFSFEESLEKTVNWSLENKEWLRV